MKYISVTEIPPWAVALINNLIASGVIQCPNGIFELPLSDEILYILLILSRKGIF